MKVIHSWLREYVGEALPDPQRVEELLTFHAFEVEAVDDVDGEAVIDVKILPDRSSDCLSHRGIARELATILDIPLKHDPLLLQKSLSVGSKITLKIEDEKLCPRFTAAVITGVKIAPSPDWLKKRLVALGQRSINNVVDATNYVMFAIGQPTHALDFDKLGKDDKGRANITIRVGQSGEPLTLLSGEEIKSDDKILHLVDGNSGALLDLAGIKGGAAAELTNDTVNIVVTSGNFNYQSVRKTSQRLKVATDASQRFQNQPSPELAGFGLLETVSLILELAGGTCDGMVEVYPGKPAKAVTRVTIDGVNKLLGLQLSKSEVMSILNRVADQVEETQDGFLVTAPWERTDLNIEVDYIEEVGRIYGLSHITSVVPTPVPLTEVNTRQYYSDKVRRVLIKLGFSEVITSSFQKQGSIQLQNALASDKSFVRENLTQNISAVLDANFGFVDLLGLTDVRVFEIGTVFSKTEVGVTEHVSLALGARTKGNGYCPRDDAALEFGLKAVQEVLGTALSWQKEKGIAELNFSESIKTLSSPHAYEPLSKQPDIIYKPICPYPAIARDIALWVEGGSSVEAVAEVLIAAAGPLLVRHTLFDTFSKAGRTSYAFRLVFQSNTRTLTDIEINETMEKVNEAAKIHRYEVR